MNVRSYLVLVDQPHILRHSLFIPCLRFEFSNFLQVQPREVELLFTLRDFNIEVDESLQKSSAVGAEVMNVY